MSGAWWAMFGVSALLSAGFAALGLVVRDWWTTMAISIGFFLIAMTPVVIHYG